MHWCLVDVDHAPITRALITPKTFAEGVRSKQLSVEDYEVDSGNDERAPSFDGDWPDDDDCGNVDDVFENELINVPHKVLVPDIMQSDLNSALKYIIFSSVFGVMLLHILLFAANSLTTLLENRSKRSASIITRHRSKWMCIC
jgi:hypothetical protein